MFQLDWNALHSMFFVAVSFNYIIFESLIILSLTEYGSFCLTDLDSPEIVILEWVVHYLGY